MTLSNEPSSSEHTSAARSVESQTPSKYEKALRELAALMDYAPDAGFGCENNCEGCQYEMVEASRIVKEALEG